jgi:hypothetical protein
MTRYRLLLLLSLFGVAAGCRPPETAEFGPPKQFSPQQRPTEWNAPRNVRLGIEEMGPVGEQGPKAWTGDTPDGWESLPAQPARFRNAVWRVAGQPDTDIYFTAGVGGGVAGNLKRWYTDQFGIAEVPAVEALPVVEIAGRAGRLAEMTGTFNGNKPGWAARIAFYANGDQVSSLKFTGPESVVAANGDKFLLLAKSLRSASPSPDAKAPPIDPGQPLPADHPPAQGAPHGGAGAAAPAPSAPFTAAPPAGWTAKAGSQRPLHHTFGGDGEVYVSTMGGGGLKPMLDIWRGEMELQPLSDAEFAALPKVAFLGEDSVLLDLSGNFRSMSGKQIQGARMLVAARLDNGAITFAKLVGPAADVAAQLAAFQQFCGSVRRAP